ncbi:MAG: BrnA antitoxin family protein [Candidatus Brevundimonas colombiensis]|uniref:BrnA antitoxin family protein n=1 Tax=Candidatus Brevundimonas colombiensis TaxID=3121376 RepID=A0AAJ5X0X6_9CAUL|nr:BrnA antitoxin family protein [Brevundimonas sp.]WEK40420.1 MAG: BrnA antitoxin family protein [Brevundimonas sp.]
MADPKLSLDPNDYADVEIDDIDNPEWTDGDFAKARPLREVMPDLYARMTGEQDVALKLSAETIKAFAEEGEDWRERMAQALTDVARNKRAA